MTLHELLKAGRLPFAVALIVALADMPGNIFAFNEREVGIDHGAPWLRRTAATIATRARSIFQAMFAFLRPHARPLAIAVALALLAVALGHAQSGVVVMIGATLPELREQKGRLANEADEILKKAAADNRLDLRKEEEDKFDAIHADIEKLSGTITRMEKQEATMASLGSGGRRTEPNETEERHAGGHRSSLKTITDHDRCEAFRDWALAGQADFQASDAARDRARRCGINLGANSLTLGFGPVMRSLHPDDVRAWQTQVDEKRAALTAAQSTTTTGGYTVADATMKALEFALLKFGGMRSVATVLRTDTGGPLPIPTSDDTANKGAILAENTGVTELEMTFGQLVMDAWKYSSKSILASVEFLQDSSINVADFIGTALGNRIGRITNDHFTTGTGSSQPNGIVTAATSSAVTFSGAATVTADNLTDLIHSVDPAYRDNARWMFHDGGLKMIKKVKVLQYSGDTVGVPLWIPGLTTGQPDMILGYPYTVNQSMTTPATTVKSILFGDFSKYLIRDVKDFTLIRLDERYAELHQVGFLAFARSDGDLLDAGTHPVKYGTQA